ncbi:MAG: Rubredoxin [uncultured Sulfurovum sp.]|uniref:ferredoxin:thioredoxin reductase n=1 Tax=uncultured Sulfurovum sp. TaxID=269237 RepID=A0A6S6T1N3_9BACT|nr:MAG: Rubredoxin [uncultured Sulfurovum sp.]
MNSEEFQTELKKTEKFVDKVYDSKGWVPNPNEDVNEGVRMGLARNKLIYGKRFCPCFMVEGETKEEQKAADNRICPCKPAIEKEIPEDGMCHCGIFCTPEFAESQKKSEVIEEVVHAHSRGLTKDEAEILLMKDQLDGDELESLMEARNLDMVSFTLIDVREQMEYNQAHIVGTDALVSTSNFYAGIEAFNDKQAEQIIVYCLSGSRSYQVQQAMGTLGFKKVANLAHGIGSFRGDTQSV